MEDEIKKLENDVALLKGRNVRVEADKAWETSSFRIFSVTGITYIVAAITFSLVGTKNFLLHAFIPAAGFFLSIQSLPFVKKWWIKKYLRKKE